jgi:hypothetical protein
MPDPGGGLLQHARQLRERSKRIPQAWIGEQIYLPTALLTSHSLSAF